MTEKDLVNALIEELALVRGKAVQSIGWPAVIALEDQGMIVVSARMPKAIGDIAKAVAAAVSTASGGTDHG